MTSRIDADWLKDAELQKLLATLSGDGEEARVVGGAVRNTLLGIPVTDMDIAVTSPPEETMARAEAAGYRVVPTGIEHGTVTVIAAGRPHEVTSLRADVETDGRHARVAFGRDWRDDAERRDFTINALYCRADGTVVDLVGGVADIEKRQIRFIGDPDARIREDYLRILRFFRFFAWYGSGRPDAEGLKASTRLKAGLARLSAERIWSELKRLLAAPDPSRSLIWMRQTGVLSAVLPETEKWGVDAIHGLVAAERDLGWQPDGLLRLESIIAPNLERVDTLAARLKLANAERERLEAWAGSPAISPQTSERAFMRLLYEGDRQAIVDRLRLSLAGARSRAAQDDKALVEAGGYSRLLRLAESWERPDLPIKGADLLAMGIEPGPRLGEVLRLVEQDWIDSGFTKDRDALLEGAASLAQADI